ncbi:MAG: GTPase RsgA, partial [Bacilli bacterium]|nr:GTPase RsgA [Bacilli bacterium]
MNGQIIRVISNLYTVKVGDMLYGCRARGKFRKDNISPIVGDNVVIDSENNVIDEILPRRNELDRPVIANVDMAFIVTSTKKPNLDLNLLDKLISVITFNNIE